MRASFFLFLSLLYIVTTYAFGNSLDESCAQENNTACVDWERGVVIAEGLGVPSAKATNQALKHASALRAAKLDASRNLLELIKGVSLNSSTVMRDAMIANDVVRTQVQGKVRGIRPIGNPRYFSDGTVKIRLEARIFDTIPEVLIKQELEKKAVEPPVLMESLPPESVINSQQVKPIDISSVYTGLVIDAKGLHVKPAMSPKVYDEKEDIVYGISNVDRDFFQKYGMAGYVKTQESALENDRVKGKPLVIRAKAVAGKNKADLLISLDDADALRQMEKTQAFLREARVIIVID